MVSVKLKKEEFISRIICDENIKKQKILKLQKDYEENKICEEDLTQEQIFKLKELYIEQIHKLKNDFESYKQKIIKLRKELN